MSCLESLLYVSVTTEAAQKYRNLQKRYITEMNIDNETVNIKSEGVWPALTDVQLVAQIGSEFCAAGLSIN